MTGYDLRHHVDDHKAAALIASAMGSAPTIAAAREQGCCDLRIRDQAIEYVMPIAFRVIRRVPSWSRVQRDDLEQGAMLGIIEAVDSFEPARGIRFQTFAWTRMRYRVACTVADEHWVTMKPPKALIRAYMSGRMTEDEVHDYLSRCLGAGFMECLSEG